MANFGRKFKNSLTGLAVAGPVGLIPAVNKPIRNALSTGIDYFTGRGAQRANNRTAEEMRRAAEEARQAQEQGYNQAYDMQQPYMEMGNTALKDLYAGLNAGKYDYQAPTNQEYNNLTQQMISQDPGVDWRLQQGVKARDASAAARGMLLSSGQAKALNNYAQNQASQEYQQAYNRASNVIQDKYAAIRDNLNNHFNRLQSFANMGPQMATNLANNRLGLAGSNAGYREDMGNINAGRYQANNRANMDAFGNILQTGMGVAGMMAAGPAGGAVAGAGISGPKSMYSMRQAPNDFYGYGDNGVKNTAPPADYEHIGNQLADLWRNGYPY